MSQENLIATLTIGLLLSLNNISDASDSGTMEELQGSELESSVLEGIRTLEYLRRKIIETSQEERGVERRLSTIDNRPYDNSNYFGTRTTERSEKMPHPRRQVDAAMYKNLSKLANIQVADSSIDDLSRGRSSKNDPSRIFDKKRPVARKFQCRPISEIYIPDVKEKMPAYLCTLGQRAFVVSSERFNTDSREQFMISVDDKTFRRLIPINLGGTRLTSGVSVLPATLVLKRGDDGYSVREIKNNSTGNVNLTDTF